MNKINAVFEGGGVKGIALVGAVTAFTHAGYEFEFMAGTSAGAIVASLLCGYSPSEVSAIVAMLNFKEFADFEGMIPGIGLVISEIFSHGVLRGEVFEQWLEELLKQRNIRTFHDLIVDEFEPDIRKRYRLHVIATDLTSGEMIVLPDDLPKYGIDIDSFSVAKAVRCSMAIPFVFNPCYLDKHVIVDGALISNLPLWLFEGKTIGFRLVSDEDTRPNRIYEGFSEMRAVIVTLLDSVDKYHIHNNDYKNCIAIPTLGVSTCDFSISQEMKENLYNSGYNAAVEQWLPEIQKKPQ